MGAVLVVTYISCGQIERVTFGENVLLIADLYLGSAFLNFIGLFTILVL